jgi:putative serine protease PepD
VVDETPIEPVEQAEQVEPVEPALPVEHTEPVEPVEPVEPAEPIEPAEQAEPVGPPEEGAPTPTPIPTPDPSRPERRQRDGRGGLRSALVAGLVGGIVGALVASGLFLAFDDDSSGTAVGSSSTPIVRPSDRIARSGDIASILRTAVPAVVAIIDDGGPESGGAAGTGFVISPDGVIVSNNHVVEGADKIQAVFADGTSRPAKVLGRNAASDLAVLKVDGTNLATLQLGDSNDVQVGDDVVAIGNALALSGGLTVTRGIISGLHREVPTDSGTTLEDLLQTDAAINPGNSGGPLVDSQGRVIGINTAIANPSTAQNVGFALPISNAQAIISLLREGRQPAFLGVTSENVDAAKAAGRSVAVDRGAYITSVVTGSPADAAGIRQGDVVVKVDDKTIESAARLGSVVRLYKPGDTVTVVVDRGGTETSLTAKLSEGPTS